MAPGQISKTTEYAGVYQETKVPVFSPFMLYKNSVLCLQEFCSLKRNYSGLWPLWHFKKRWQKDSTLQLFKAITNISSIALFFSNTQFLNSRCKAHNTFASYKIFYWKTIFSFFFRPNPNPTLWPLAKLFCLSLSFRYRLGRAYAPQKTAQQMALSSVLNIREMLCKC